MPLLSLSSSSSKSSSSLSDTHRMDNLKQGDVPSVSHDNIPSSNLINIDYCPLDNTTWSEDDLLGCDQLQEDMEDDDGAPLSQIYHPLLDSMFNLSNILTD